MISIPCSEASQFSLSSIVSSPSSFEIQEHKTAAKSGKLSATIFGLTTRATLSSRLFSSNRRTADTRKESQVTLTMSLQAKTTLTQTATLRMKSALSTSEVQTAGISNVAPATAGVSTAFKFMYIKNYASSGSITRDRVVLSPSMSCRIIPDLVWSSCYESCVPTY